MARPTRRTRCGLNCHVFNRPRNRGNFNGSTKVAAEAMVRAYTHRGWLEGVALRLPGIYGYGRFRGGSKLGFILQQVILHCLKGRGATLPPDLGSNEYIYVADVAIAVRLALEARELRRTVYNIGTGQVRTPAEVARVVEEVVPGARVEYGAAGIRQKPLDVTLAAAELGFRARYSLKEGTLNLARCLTQGLVCLEKVAGDDG